MGIHNCLLLALAGHSSHVPSLASGNVKMLLNHPAAEQKRKREHEGGKNSYRQVRAVRRKPVRSSAILQPAGKEEVYHFFSGSIPVPTKNRSRFQQAGLRPENEKAGRKKV